MAHLKRLAAPRSWKIRKKENKWVARPSPGPHPLERAIPLAVALRDILKYANNMREARKVLNTRTVLVNGKVRIDPKFPVGLMDVLELKASKEFFKVKLDKKGKLAFDKSDKPDHRLCRVENKKVLGKGKIQLNLWGGTNLVVGKDEYKVGDVLKIDLKDNKVKGKIELKEGSTALVIGGSHVGELSKIKKLSLDKRQKEAELEAGFNTPLEYIYVVK